MGRMKETIIYLIRWYGNRTFKSELLISFLIIVLLSIFKISISPMDNFIDTLDDSLISFFGIIFGFLITSFTFLLTFNPENNNELNKLKKSEDYKSLLSSYLFSSIG